jgi:hypothetical protein
MTPVGPTGRHRASAPSSVRRIHWQQRSCGGDAIGYIAWRCFVSSLNLDGALLAEVEVSDGRTIPVIQKIKMEDRRMALLLARPFRDLQRMAQRWESPFPRLFEDFEDNYDEGLHAGGRELREGWNKLSRA